MSSNVFQFPTPRANLAQYDLKVNPTAERCESTDLLVDEIEEILEDIRLSVNCMSYDPSSESHLKGIKTQLVTLQACADYLLHNANMD